MDFPDKIKKVKENIELWLNEFEKNNPDKEVEYKNGRKDTIQGWKKEINGQDGFSYLIQEFATVNELEGDRNYGEEKVIMSETEHREVINYLTSKDYLEIIEDQPPNIVLLGILPKTKPIIKPKTLELIARELKDHYTGTEIIALLQEAGVDKRLIIYPQSKWLIFYKVFSELTNHQKDRELLYKIICNAIHPLNLNGNTELSNQLKIQFNEYLKYDALEITDIQGGYTIIDQLPELSDEEKQEIIEEIEEEREKQLTYLCQSENREKISLLRKAFQLLMNVVEVFCENSSNPTSELNNTYQFLDKLVLNKLNELNLRGDVYINFNHYSSPFVNLFAAEKIYKEKGKELSWQKIRPEMNAIYGDIEELYQEVNGSDILAEPDQQRKINEIQLYLSKLKEETEKTKKIKTTQIPKVEIIGLQDGLKAIAQTKKEEGKNKFPYKLPAGTEWKNFIIQFLNKEEVYIQVNRFKHNENYAKMRFADNRFSIPKPNEGWTFLWVLAKYNGELTIKDPDAKDTYKKQKELVSKALKSYFSMESDPFFPYQETKSYKTRFALLPPPEESEEMGKKHQITQTGIEHKSVDEEIRQFFEEQAPQVYDEQGW